MKPFAEFCAHYQLDSSSAEAQAKYDAYCCSNLALFRCSMAEQQEERPEVQTAQQMPTTTSQGGEA